jgi:hypothetical protein
MIEKKTHTKEMERAKQIKNGKIGRNDVCNCGSEKKYKKCCGAVMRETKFTTGQSISSEKCKTILNYLNEEEKYKQYRFIDITDDLTPANYREYQIKNYNNNIVMIAEKKENNIGVFLERDKDDLVTNDMILLHAGSYRIINSSNIERYSFTGFL